MSVSGVPSITLSDGNSIPQFGFGVYKVESEETRSVVAQALEAGYRHVDTAEMYGNERAVGEAIRASGLRREEVFVTSKLDNGFHEPEDARRAFEGSLSELGFDYLDLFLIHWPLPNRYGGDFVSTWKTLEEFRDDGRARSIGVSNFQPEHLERLAGGSETVPAVNQIQSHPYMTNDGVREYCLERGIAIEAWSPLARGGIGEDHTLSGISDKFGKTSAQVVLRWHLQRGNIVERYP